MPSRSAWRRLARRGRLEPVEPTRPRSATPATACSTRRRSAATSSDGRSWGLATMPRMRTSASIRGGAVERPGVEEADERAAPLAGQEAGTAVEELPRHAQQLGRAQPATASGAGRARCARRGAGRARRRRRRRRRTGRRRAWRRAARRSTRPGGAVAADVAGDGRTGVDARRVARPRAKRRTCCSSSSVDSGSANEGGRARAGGIDGADVVRAVRPWCERHPEVVVDVGGHPHMR